MQAFLRRNSEISISLFVSNNKTDCHNITEILLKMVLNTIILTLININMIMIWLF